MKKVENNSNLNKDEDHLGEKKMLEGEDKEKNRKNQKGRKKSFKINFPKFRTLLLSVS